MYFHCCGEFICDNCHIFIVLLSVIMLGDVLSAVPLHSGQFLENCVKYYMMTGLKMNNLPKLCKKYS